MKWWNLSNDYYNSLLLALFILRNKDLYLNSNQMSMCIFKSFLSNRLQKKGLTFRLFVFYVLLFVFLGRATFRYVWAGSTRVILQPQYHANRFCFFFKAGASLVVHNLIQFMNYDFFVKNLYYDSIVTC